MPPQLQCCLVAAPQQGVQRAAAGRLLVHTGGVTLHHTPSVWDGGPSGSRGCSEHLRPSRRGSPRALAHPQSLDQLGPGDWQQRDVAALQAASSPQLPTAGDEGEPAAAPAGDAVPAQLLPVQEQGGASLLHLVAAWDQLAARLPPAASTGRAADLILGALKLAVAHSPPPPAAAGAAADGSGTAGAPQAALPRPVARALSLASRLADLAAEGLPVDAESIAAAILAEVVAQPSALPAAPGRPGGGSGGDGPYGALTLQGVEERVGPIVAQLVHDIQRARALPSRLELLDDTAASALRELCLSFYDVRATAVEVVARLDLLSGGGGLPPHEQQVCALEALQMYAPMGHALGLSAVAAQLEDRCFQILFPESYIRTAAWLQEQAAANAATLAGCQAALRAAVEAQPRFAQLAGGVEVKGRAKTLFSTLKKLLRLGNTAAGGRARAQLHDLIGLRAVVLPRGDLPAEEAEALAAEACYLVRDAALRLWQPVAGRCKDYVAAPKPNGYQSLHSTLRVAPEAGAPGSHAATLELQIRTQAMDDRAERGEAAHTAYKGGLDSTQAQQLKAVKEAVLRRTATAAAAAACVAPPQLGGGDAAAEGLFRHLDQNGDGRISLEELQFALQELGVRGAGAQSRAAAELLQLAAADGGGSSGDGTIGFEAFMALQRRVGLLQALCALDAEQAGLLERQQREELEAAAVGSLGSADVALSSLDPGGGGAPSSSGMRAAAAGPRATAERRGALRGGWPAGCGVRRGASVAARAFLETSSASSSTDSSQDECEAASSSGSSGVGAASRVGPGAANSVVALQDWRRGGEQHSEAAAAPAAAPPAAAAQADSDSGSGASTSSIDGEAPVLRKPERQGWAASRAVQGILRLVGQAGPPAAAATWQLVAAPANPYAALDAAGGAVPPPALDRPQELRLPEMGPCVIGAVFDRDCDYVLDVPTVSARHARLEVVRRPDAKGGYSKLLLADLGSTNGTRVNRAPIQPNRDVTLHPGDVVTFAEEGIAYRVAALPPPTPAPAPAAAPTDNGGTASVEAAAATAAAAPAAAGGELGLEEELAAAREAAAAAPPVVAALRLAAQLEAAAAAAGHFPPGGAVYADLGERVRQLAAAGSHEEAHAALLAGVMQQPWSGALWAQLANMERQRARAAARGASYAVARACYGAAAACFAAMTPAAAGGALRAEAERAEGLGRVLGGWAQLELSLGHTAVARTLFRRGVAAARAHPVPGAGGAAAARLLFTWAHREWKAGEGGEALRLAGEALEAEPDNPYALSLLGNIQAAAGQPRLARRLFERALAARPDFVSALQSLARLEASRGRLPLARELFQRALKGDPRNTHVLQAWAVAEARAGRADAARALLRRCTDADPGCRAAWHAWGRLEERVGDEEEAVRLYTRALQLKPDCVPALTSLGRLQLQRGQLEAAEQRLQAALAADPAHLPAVAEMARLRREQGAEAEAARLLKRVRRLNADRAATRSEVALRKLPEPVRAAAAAEQEDAAAP